MNRVELQGLKTSRLVKARLLQWRLLSRRRPPARWFGGGGSSTGGGGADAYLNNEYSSSGTSTSGSAAPRSPRVSPPRSTVGVTKAPSVAAAAIAVAAATEALGGQGCCHHRQLNRPAFLQEAAQAAQSQLGTMAVSCPELLEQIFHYVRSRELRAVTLLGRAFKFQLDCPQVWRQLYFLRFSTAFGKFKSWKLLYIQRDERCDRIKAWRHFFERSRQHQQQPPQPSQVAA